MTFSQGHRFAAVALFASLAACSTAPKAADIDPFAVEPVVTKAKNAANAAPAPDADAKAAAALASLEAAESAWRAGDANGALAIASRALIDGVPADLEGRFREIRTKARAEVVATKICRVRVVPEKDAVADGGAIPVRVEFTNLSGAPLSVPKTQKGSSSALVVLALTREDYDVYGNQHSTEFALNLPLLHDLELAPGATESLRPSIPPELSKLTHEGFSVVAFAGTFRPVVMRLGESEFFDAIPIERATVRVFKKGYEPLAADPLGSLKKAIAKRSPPHLLTATELLSPTDRAAARKALEEAKTNDRELAPVVDAALARLAALR